jgi:hypothetical protein
MYGFTQVDGEVAETGWRSRKKATRRGGGYKEVAMQMALQVVIRRRPQLEN